MENSNQKALVLSPRARTEVGGEVLGAGAIDSVRDLASKPVSLGAAVGGIAGFMLGGPLGAAVGAGVGHWFSKR